LNGRAIKNSDPNAELSFKAVKLDDNGLSDVTSSITIERLGSTDTFNPQMYVSGTLNLVSYIKLK